MTGHATGGAPNIFPFLRYLDAKAAVRWLCGAFGFEEKEVHPGPDGTIAHAELRLGPGVVMLGSAKDDVLGLRTPREVGAATGGIYVSVDDVDAHFQRAVAAGAEVVAGPAETDFGSREYGARDPEGNLWWFGSYRP